MPNKLLCYIGDEMPVMVEYDYQPFEPVSVSIENGDAYPGFDASAEVFSVKFNEFELIDSLSDDCKTALSDACVEYENEPNEGSY